MRAPFFYGYVILALCFSNMVFVRGILGSFGVLYVALLEEFRWSHGAGAGIASVNSLIYALSSPLIGWSLDRLGPRILMPLSGALVGIGLFLSGLSNSLWELYFYYGVVTAIGIGGLGFVSHNALISHWFVRRRGSAIGLATMGLGLGALIIVPLTQYWISQVGWRSTLMILAAVLWFTTVPANALWQRRNPQEVGQFPDGDQAPFEDPSSTSGNRQSAGREWTLGSAFRSFPFWSIALGHLALGAGLFMIYTHLVAHLVHEGSDKLVAAFIVGLMGFMRTAGTAFWGLISDRLGRDQAYGMATLFTLSGILCLVATSFSPSLWFLYGLVILYGIGHSSGNPTYGAMIGDIFAGKKLGTIFGFLEITFGLGSAFGTWLGGYIFDLTGSYRWAFSLCILTFTISYLAVHASLVWHGRELARRQDGRLIAADTSRI